MKGIKPRVKIINNNSSTISLKIQVPRVKKNYQSNAKKENNLPLEVLYNHIYVCPDNLPRNWRKFYCERHTLPWCIIKEMPCCFCNCEDCKKLPKRYRKTKPECEKCKPSEYDVNHFDEQYYYHRYVPLDFIPPIGV